jgi:hypothetical protein
MAKSVSKPKLSSQKMIYKKVLVIALFAGIFIFALYSVLKPESAGTGPEYTTFRIYSDKDNEDVSDFVEIKILGWDADKRYTEQKDLRRLSNFETLVSTKDAVDVEVDLTEELHGVWIIIDPDNSGVFATNYIYLNLEQNIQDYPLRAYHQPEDVNFNILDNTDFSAWAVNETTDGNYTLIFDFPNYDTSDIHANSNDWDMTDDDWEDLTDAEKEYYYDQANFRTWAPTYDPAVDTDKDYSTVFEKYTSVPAFVFTSNDSLSTIDENANQVNVTIAEEFADYIKVQVSGTYLFFLISENVSPGTIKFEISMGSGIQINTVRSCFATVAGDESSATVGTVLSTIAA